MTRIVCSLGLALLCGVALAVETPDLTAQQKELEQKRTDLRAKEQEARERLAQSDAVKDLRKKTDEARKQYAKKIAESKDLKKAREAEQAATANLEKVIAQGAASSPETAAIAEQRKALEAKRRELLYRQGLVELQLTHPGSPLVREAESDSDVVKLRQAAVAAEEDLKQNPSAETAAARKSLAEAQAALGVAEQKVKADPKVAKAGEEVRKKEAELKAKEAEDPRHAAVAEAKKAAEAAREEALAKLPEAKKLLDEQVALAKQVKEVTAQRDAAAFLLDSDREALRAGDDKDVSAARAKFEEAQQAQAKLLQSGAFRELNLRVEEAETKYKETFDKTAGKNAEYAALDVQAKALEAKLEELKAKALKTSSAKDLQALCSEVAAVRLQLDENNQQRHVIRAKDVELDKRYWERSRAQGAVKDAAKSDPAAAAAGQAVRDAERALQKALDAKLPDVKGAKELLKQKQALTEQLAELRYHEALARYQLNNANSPFAAPVGADAGVAAKREAFRAAEMDLKDNPSSKVAAAAGKLAEARAEDKAAVDQARQEAGYAQPDAARRAAEGAARKAEEADPRNAAVAQARQALADKRAEKVRKQDEGKKLLEEQKTGADELAKIEPEFRKLSGQVGDVRKKVQTGDSPEVAAARKQLEDARKALKDAEAAPELAALLKQADDAEQGAKAKAKELLTTDAAYLGVQKDLAGVEQQLKEVNKKIRETAPKK